MIHHLYRIIILLGLSTVFMATSLPAQVYFSRTAHVAVQSTNNIKNIEADNYQVVSSIEMTTGDIRFEGLLKSFEFRLGALDRVFSSDRIDVSQYPKFRFEGKVYGLEDLDLKGTEPIEVDVKGTLYLWDEKRITSAKGMVTPDGKGGFVARSSFLMTIEEKSMHKLNALIDARLPDAIHISTESFGVSRDISVALDAAYQKRNW